MLQTVPLLARIAAEAGEMRVCSGILLLTLLNPVEVAENAATLDAITDGRFVLGLGLGYRQEENDAFGLPERRLRIFEQKLDVVRRLLEGEAVTAEGHGFRLDDQRLALRPAQRPRPPIWLAANSDEAVLRAARLADAWLLNPHTKLVELERQIGPLPRRARALRARGRQPRCRSSRSSTSARTTRPRCAPCSRTSQDKYEAYVQWGQDEVLPAGRHAATGLRAARRGRALHRRRPRDLRARGCASTSTGSA